MAAEANEEPIELTRSKTEEIPESPADTHDKSDHGGATPGISLQGVSWFQQFYWTTWKNCLMLTRRPILLFLFIFSSVISAVLSWLVGRDPRDENVILAPITEGALNECGMLDDEYIDSLPWYKQYNVWVSLNENWRSGAPVSLLSLGPLANAVIVFLFVHGEMGLHLLGILRSLGLRESVYWMSWYAPFAALAFINSLLGAIACKMASGHVYESVYFFGFFISLFLLQLALIPASFFLAAVCGTGSKALTNFILVILLFATWVVHITQVSQSSFSGLSTRSRRNTWPRGLFWQNVDTLSRGYDYTSDGFSRSYNYTSDVYYCDQPLVSEDQGTWYKFEEDRAKVEDDEIFVGCYIAASWGATIWNDPGAIGNLFLFPFPYFHFMTIFGNFVGYTSLVPELQFTAKEASLTMEELSIQALPNPPDPARGGPSKLAPQQSTFILDSYYPNQWFSDASPCPLPNKTGYEDFFCPNINDCRYVKDPGAVMGTPTTNDMYGFLLALAVLYFVLAWYWAQVFPSTNGRGERFYFIVQPGYWFRSSSASGGNASSENGGGDADTPGVLIDNVRKSYGNFDALKGVSFRMAQGEVTALLGHNGAGKTTLSSIISCDNAATEGDVTVFGHSVVNDPFAVRQMVGLCKQDDYLWPLLTAKEHLDLFAGLRGVSQDRRGQMVQKWLESVDLDLVQLQYPTQYSGGMKRRLSLALATVGDRPLIILDEPTTGMDPVSRRFVWRHIDEIKENRVILLTTHAMEEADLLADEVAIVRKGELAAMGSPLQLKADHGTALQFALLVKKDDLDSIVGFINLFFEEYKKIVAVEVTNAGNIDVKIQKLQQDGDEEGVAVELLSEFVGWLDGEESKVTEYGFSNSSLEEVFLEVTRGDEEEAEQQTGSDEATAPTDQEDEVEAGNVAKVNDISSFQPNLQVLNQIRVLHSDFYKRTWTGRGSGYQKGWFGLLAIGALLLGLGVASDNNPTSWFILVLVFLSFILTSTIAPMYSDRFEGQFYLMQTQGLLSEAYVSGFGLYSFTVTTLYTLIVLSLLFASPVFRDPDICDGQEDDFFGCWRYGFGQKALVQPTTISNYYDEYNGERVELQAYRTPGGYGFIVMISFMYGLAAIGGALSTAFFPGFKIPMVLVTFASIIVCVWPVIEVLAINEEEFKACEEKLSMESCEGNFYLNNTEDLVECVGRELNLIEYFGNYCLSPVSAILPQFGVYQGLVMAFQARVTFISEPPNYVEDVLMPNLEGRCRGSSCVNPAATRLFWLNMVFMFVGAILLVIVGYVLAHLFVLPSGIFLKLRHAVDKLMNILCCRKEPKLDDGPNDGEAEFDVVTKEREAVIDMVRKIVDEPETKDSDFVFHPEKVEDRNSISPVLMHKLRKVYPGLGGRLPKVALQSLSMHVPKGQVLGLLGKNGAGKTTALKILAGAHEKSGGLGLVAGYDSDMEKIDVFERLGNCAQFDVVWRGRSVRDHLEFFASLKGLPKDQTEEAARAVAVAVGLGTDEVYARDAGALSGGMRRRLSIAMSLLGSPAVVILDEPTTGLDPSTRSTIWGLITSFATPERSTIITTHMMIEADTLCSRIAIVSQGKLKVIGTQQYLKDTFGSGYLLQVNLVHSGLEYQERAMDFIRRKLHKDAVLSTKQAKTLHIHLPRDLKLDDVFRALYSKERGEEGCINQFLLSQSSLEDVFISLGD